MPYRHAHWWLVALFPLIGLAFWPNYIGVIGTAPFALHAHGLTAALWIALAAFQSWTIANRRSALHRSAGLALFAVVPAFAAGGLLAIRGTAGLFAAQSDPFHGRYGARLAFGDLIAVVTFLVLVHSALITRANVRRHAAAMLATVLLVLPPILGRVLPLLPGFPNDFGLAFHAAEILAAALAAWLWSRDRAHGAAFLIVIVSNLVQSLAFVTIAATYLWSRNVLRIAALPPAPLALLGLALGGMIVWHGWTSGRPARRAALAG